MFSRILYILIGVIVLVFLLDKYVIGKKAVRGGLAPDLSAALVSGEKFELRDLRGNYVLVSFWGSWCGPCIQEAPGLVKLYEDFQHMKSNKGEKFEIVSIALEKNDRNWKTVAARLGFNWRYQIVEISKMIMFSQLAGKFNVTELPAKFLIDPKGRIININLSAKEVGEFLEKNLIQKEAQDS